MYLFLDYLEVLLVALLICIFCDVEQKNRYCLISSVISFLVMEFMQTYDLFGNEMAYAITIINFIIVSVMKKEIKFCFISSGFNIFISELILSPLPPTYLFYCSMLIYVLSNG